MGTRRGDPTRRRRVGLTVLAALVAAVTLARKSLLDAADAAFPAASSRVG